MEKSGACTKPGADVEKKFVRGKTKYIHRTKDSFLKNMGAY